MQTPSKPAISQPSLANANLPEPARRAWAVKFVVPAPQSMPSDRLKARAQLVRNALSSTGY